MEDGELIIQLSKTPKSFSCAETSHAAYGEKIDFSKSSEGMHRLPRESRSWRGAWTNVRIRGFGHTVFVLYCLATFSLFHYFNYSLST